MVVREGMVVKEGEKERKRKRGERKGGEGGWGRKKTGWGEKGVCGEEGGERMCLKGEERGRE